MDEILTDDQLCFLREAKLAAKKIKMEGIKENENSTDVLKKIGIIAENLELLIDNLKNGGTARVEFIRKFPTWIEKRRENIESLREIAEFINSDRFYCDVSKLFANITSLFGGGLVLASAVLIPFTGGLSIPAGITAGTIMTAAGSATSFGTALTELLLVKNNVDKAKTIIKEDEKLLKTMCKWMDHADKLIAAQSEILKIDIVENVFSEVKELVKEGRKIKNSDKRIRYIEKKIKKIIRRSSKNKNISEMGSLTIVSLLIGIYVLTSNTECRFLFDCASLTVKISTTGAILLLDEILDLTGLVCTNFSKDVAKATACGTFAVIGMTLDTASIILTSIDLYKGAKRERDQGSFSTEAKKIFDAADGLEKEAKLLENVYNNLVENLLYSPENNSTSILLEEFYSYFERNFIPCFLFLLVIVWCCLAGSFMPCFAFFLCIFYVYICTSS